MRRREFIAAFSAGVAWPSAGRAQQPLPVIGFVGAASPEATQRYVAGFRSGLAELGYLDGRNVVIEYRWAEGQNDRIPALVAELVQRRVTVATPGSNHAAIAAKAATTYEFSRQ